MFGSKGLTFGQSLGVQVAGNATNGLFGLFSNWINNSAQKRLYEQQYRDSLAFYNMQMQDQWDMWNANNAYNSPANQAARLREAGINPDLQGVDNASASMPTAPTPNVPQQGYTPLSAEIFAILPNILETFERFQQLEANSISLDKATNSLVDDYLMNLPTSTDFQKLLNGDSAAVQHKFNEIWDSLPPMSRARKQLFGNKMYSRLRNPEVLKRYYSAMHGTGESLFDIEQLTGNPNFSGTGSASKALNDFLKLVNDVDKATMQYNRDYYNTASGTSAGEAANTGNETILQQKGQVNELIDKFLNSGDGPNTFKMFLAILARMWFNGQISGPNLKVGPTNNTFLKVQ